MAGSAALPRIQPRRGRTAHAGQRRPGAVDIRDILKQVELDRIRGRLRPADPLAAGDLNVG
jgi:hypothetical protein